MIKKNLVKVILKSLRYFFIGLFLLIFLFVGYFFIRSKFKEPLNQVRATVHSDFSRESCAACHEPIANEWNKSYHLKSINGLFMKRLKKKGILELQSALRVPCMNCHAPANVLDVDKGKHPTQRIAENELGVDCVSCHVSKKGIIGPGIYTDAPHEVYGDKRFTNGTLTSISICATCHNEENVKVIEEWKNTKFANEDTNCVSCHMPKINAPIVSGGPAKLRRSHSFKGDKDMEMLKKGLNATLNINKEQEAVIQITNDRVGHSFPAAGMNALIAKIAVYNQRGEIIKMKEYNFKRLELAPGYLHFWPFLQNSTIPYGETRNLKIKLPEGHGKVSVKFSYRDWFAIKDKDIMIFSNYS